MRTHRLVMAALAAAAVLALSSPARAQQPEPPDPKKIEEAKQHFAKGRELYDAGDKQGAVEEFKEAYKLSKNPLLLYNIGLVYDELHDKPLAVHYYEKFLELAPDNEKTKENKALAAERVKVLKREIADEEAAAAKPPVPDGGDGGAATKPSTGGGVTEFTHAVIDEAPPGKPLDIIARIPETADWRLTLYYRTAGEDQFASVKMRPRYTEMVGRIPPESMRGSSVQYYIEVKDPAGKMIASTGRASSPNIVYIDAGAKPHYYEDLTEGGSGSLAGEGDDDDDDDGPIPGGKRGGGPVDRNRTREYAKWATTAGTVVFLGSALALYLAATDQASTLEGEAYDSTQKCGATVTPPCVQFSDSQQGLESSGQAYETWANVTFVLGLGSAAAAGVLWYLDLKAAKRAPAASTAPADDEASRGGIRITGAPLVGPDLIGGAAIIQW